ncbi:molybdopterin-binding domain-containing protein [Rubrivivax gelatinosus]|uniref:Formylmethanofuran dehydrogenase subunit B n=1 Tax=Rubrivivax gelatinosus TaxID=28068 RepID=A0ABS1DY14_RUBGE|nr:formylmethanofuran dehydrogenase [Rubrivivax gelatinosus]MBK1714972.1 hypothetical protein [Rubrivivax gelatinosus]
MTDTVAATPAWTCPFCPLACDHLGVRVGAGDEVLALDGGDCARASRRLASFASRPVETRAEIAGRPASADAALAAAAALLAGAAQPLFAGLGCDVAGARALYPLACATGAVTDAAGGEALFAGLRALQDRGQFTTTLGELRTRADLIVFVGGLPVELAPLIAERCGLGDAGRPQRHVVALAPPGGHDPALAAWASEQVTVETVAAEDGEDLAATLQRLLTRVPRPQTDDNSPLSALATRLRAAHYAVFVGAPALLAPQAALAIEAVHAIVGHLNRKTRAAALWIGGGDGAATANQVFTWLSGLPLRTRASALGLEHEPFLYATDRLLADGAVDALLWVSSWDAEAVPPPTDLPTVVLGHPAQAAAWRREGCVFIPVSTPGIADDGHLFRTDGTVLMPLHAVRPDALPSVAKIAQALLQAVLEARR